MGEKRIGQSQPGKEETGTLTTKPGCGDREDDEWMDFNDWWENYLNAAGGGDCQPTDVAGAITEAASWLNAALQECSARANALLPVMNKVDDQDTLSALCRRAQARTWISLCWRDGAIASCWKPTMSQKSIGSATVTPGRTSPTFRTCFSPVSRSFT